jgi:acyl carrier protein
VAEVPVKIRRVIEKRLEVAEARVTRGASFRDDLGADSLALVDLTLAVEEEFDIEISDDEAARVCTVGEAVDIIERHVAEARAQRDRRRAEIAASRDNEALQSR